MAVPGSAEIQLGELFSFVCENFWPPQIRPNIFLCFCFGWAAFFKMINVVQMNTIKKQGSKIFRHYVLETSPQNKNIINELQLQRHGSKKEIWPSDV
jgi:hypothetical protein